MIFGRPIRVSPALPLGAAVLLAVGYQALGHEPSAVRKPGEAVRRQMSLPIPDFSLKDQDGSPFSFRRLRGKLVVVAFVYTTCPDICPLITSSLRQVQKGLQGGERRSIFFLSITTDPEIDSPEVLKSYGERYGIDFSNWSLLTGEPNEVRLVWKVFGVEANRKGRGLIDHTSLTALADKKGVVRFAYHGTSPDPKVILRDLRVLLSSR